MEEMLIWALIVAEIIIIGIALYITFRAEEFHKNEKAHNEYLKELLKIEKEENKEYFQTIKDLVKDISYLTNEAIKLVKKEK